jgi:hypothetical protein
MRRDSTPCGEPCAASWARESAVQLMNSAIYRTRGGESITTRNHPLPYTKKETVFLSGVSSFFVAIGVVIGFAFISAFYASFLVLERESNVKHQQVPVVLVLLVRLVVHVTFLRMCRRC